MIVQTISQTGHSMRVAIVHGYFLHDSGSGVYVRELSRALVQLGHDVTLVCQERNPELYDFIDAAYVLERDNVAMKRAFHAVPKYSGTCRLVRPDLGGKLLVYVQGAFPGFGPTDVVAFQSASADLRTRYIEANVRALKSTFSTWPPDVVLAQHLIMQPHIVRTALGGRAPYIVTEHGSALNFSVRRSEPLVPFAKSGLEGCAAAVSVSPGARDDLVRWAAEHGLDIADKTIVLPPGINADVFRPAENRGAAIQTMRARVELPAGFDIDEDDDVIAFAGPLRATKGVQHLVAALPLIGQSRATRQRLLIAGSGPAGRGLERLSALAAVGDWAQARRTVRDDPELQSPDEYGDVVIPAAPLPDAHGTAFLGHLAHEQLASVFASADVAVVPSVFPEAVALVSIEALSCGALPLAAYHSGLTALDDLLAENLHDDTFVSLTLGPDLTSRLASLIVRLLERYPTADVGFRGRIHEMAARHYPSWQDVATAYLGLTRSDSIPRSSQR